MDTINSAFANIEPATLTLMLQQQGFTEGVFPATTLHKLVHKIKRAILNLVLFSDPSLSLTITVIKVAF